MEAAAMMSWAGPLLLTLAAPSAASFAEAWYREVVLGDPASAAEIYQRVYEETGSGSSRSSATPEVRRRAALRAGGCFEKIGDLQRARAAYGWLLAGGPVTAASMAAGSVASGSVASGSVPSTPATLKQVSLTQVKGGFERDLLSKSASLRLLDLAEAAPSSAAPAASPAPSVPPVPAAAPPAGAGQLLQLYQARVERREALMTELGNEIRRQADQARSETRLRRKLLELGLEAEIEESGAAALEGKGAAPEAALDGEDREFLSLELAERFYLRGLRELRDRNPAGAARELKKALHYRPDHRDARDLVRLAEGFLKPMEGIAELAAQRLEERHFRREPETVQSLRAALMAPAQPAAQGKSAGAAIERARALEEWGPLPVRRSAKVRALVAEADARVISAGFAPSASSGGSAPAAGAPAATVAASGARAVERYEELRERGRRAARGLLDLEEQLCDLLCARSDPGRPMKLSRAAGEEAEAAALSVSEEMEALLARGEEKRRLAPAEQSLEGWRREFGDLLILVQWFPELDADRRFRKLAQDYLGR